MVVELQVVLLVVFAFSRPEHPESIHVLMNLRVQHSDTPPGGRGWATTPVLRMGLRGCTHMYIYIYPYIYACVTFRIPKQLSGTLWDIHDMHVHAKDLCFSHAAFANGSCRTTSPLSTCIATNAISGLHTYVYIYSYTNMYISKDMHV
jgi:hypothetical protein